MIDLSSGFARLLLGGTAIAFFALSVRLVMLSSALDDERIAHAATRGKLTTSESNLKAARTGIEALQSQVAAADTRAVEDQRAADRRAAIARNARSVPPRGHVVDDQTSRETVEHINDALRRALAF